MKWFRRTEDRRLTPADLLTALEEQQEVLEPTLLYKPPAEVTARQDSRHPAAQAVYLPVGAEQYLADASTTRLLRIAESLIRSPYPTSLPGRWDIQVADALHERAAQLEAEDD